MVGKNSINRVALGAGTVFCVAQEGLSTKTGYVTKDDLGNC